MNANWFFIVCVALITACASESTDEPDTSTPQETANAKPAVDTVVTAPEKVETVMEEKTEVKAVEKKAPPKPQPKPAPAKKEPVANTVAQKTTTQPKKAPKPVAPAKTSLMQFSSTTHNFGQIDQGESVEVTFSFTNTGNAPLQIMDAQASCGCTTPSFPFLPIEPGQTGKIDVTYNSTGKLGPQRPTITVITNDPKKIHKLHLQGFVMAELAEESTKESKKDSTEGSQK